MKFLISVTNYIYVVFLLAFLIILCSCQKDLIEIENENIIFVNEDENFLWIDSKKLDLQNLKEELKILEKERQTSIYFYYDEKLKNIWAYCYGRNEKKDSIYFYSVSNDCVNLDDCIELNDSHIVRGVFDDEVIQVNYTDDGKNYVKKNIKSNIAYVLNVKEYLYPIGFHSNKIFCPDGYYDIDRLEFKNYHFFDIDKMNKGGYWWNIRPSSDGNKIVGLNKKNEIMIYDLQTEQVSNTKIKRKKIGGARYTNEKLYYISEDYLYYSKDVFYFWELFLAFFPNNSYSPPVEWYRYDLKTGETVRVKTPTNSVSILGIQ